MRRLNSDKIFDVVNLAVMLILLAVFLWPLWFVIIASFSSPEAVQMGEVLVLPKKVTLEGYKRILHYSQIWTGYKNTIIVTLVGTALNMVFSVCLAYPLSVKTFAPRNAATVFVLITMYFSGGLIPNYLLMKQLGLVNTLWAMILPGMISVYNSLIIRSFFMNSIPSELREAATLDGAGDASYLFRVVLPLSKPVFAVVGLYYMVAHWNNFTYALYYIYTADLYPLQTVLRELLMSSKMVADMNHSGEDIEQILRAAQMMQYGVIMVAAAPMLCIYPFVQKYFVKGAMVGAVKG